MTNTQNFNTLLEKAEKEFENKDYVVVVKSKILQEWKTAYSCGFADGYENVQKEIKKVFGEWLGDNVDITYSEDNRDKLQNLLDRLMKI